MVIEILKTGIVIVLDFYQIYFMENILKFAKNPKCGYGVLERRNRGGYKTEGEPFVGCSEFFSEEKCDYKHVFKNGIYKNSNYLIDSYW